MNNLSSTAKIYIWSTILIGLGLTARAVTELDWANPLLYVLAGLGAAAQTLKVEGPNSRTNYSIAWFVYGFAFIALGPGAVLWVIVISHLVEWLWHKYPWYIQVFNIGNHLITVFLAGWVFVSLNRGSQAFSLSLALALAAANLTFVFINHFLLAVVVKLARGQTFAESGLFEFLTLFIDFTVLSMGAVTALVWHVNPFASVLNILPLLLLYHALRVPALLRQLLSAMENSNRNLVEANQAGLRLNAELFQSLAKVFDMRDPYVGGHAAQVATYAVAIATEMGLPSERIEIIRQSAFLHDIGKLAIPEAILHKPGKLTEIEYQLIKKHTEIGGDLLASTEGLKHLAPFVRHHHERWDGHGYPFGLAGENIPLEARILNVCDSVESMASDRPYHRGMSLQEITAEVQRCRGTQFDPEVVNIFVMLIQSNGPAFVINSARSVTQQYAASLLANESLTHNMFAWVFEKEAQRELLPVKSPLGGGAGVDLAG